MSRTWRKRMRWTSTRPSTRPGGRSRPAPGRAWTRRRADSYCCGRRRRSAAQGDELARLETLDNGKAIRETRAQVNASADYFEYYGGWADKLEGHVVPVRGRFHTYTVLEPIGVCGQIIPWNSPLPQAAQKLAPALAAGCTTIPQAR